jgi:hypothetical protein
MKIELKQMKLKYYLILVFVLVYSSNLNAQNTLDKITGLSSTSASVAYSLRQLSTSYTGPLVRIKVVNSFYDVYPDASTTKFSLSSKISAAIGTYDAAVATAGSNALSTIITGSTDATVAIWYDQSGNGVHVLRSDPNAKIITAGSINTIFGQPTIYFSGSNSSLGSSNTVDYSALSQATVNAVAQNIATTSGFAGIIGTGATPITYPGYNTAYSSSSGYGSDGHNGFYSTSVTSTDIKIVTNIFINNTTNLSKIYVNKELKTNVAGTSSTNAVYNTPGSKIFIGVSRSIGSTSRFIGNISEAIIFPSQLSDEVRNPLETNQTQTYLGPSVTITSSASGAVCAGTSVTFTATTYNFSNPYYQWYANGTPISGATSATYSTTSLVNGDQVNVKVNEGPFGGAATSNGLLLNLDATNPSSYSGSGTTWNNLVTGNEVTNFTIQSGGTYSTDNGGVIRFGNSIIGAGASSSTGFSNLSAYTVEVWVKPAGTMGDYDPSVVGNTNYTPCFFAEKSSGSKVNMVLAYNARGLTSGTANNSYRYEAAINSGGWKPHQIATNYSSDLNNWVQIISTYDGSKLTIYRNGVSLGSSAALGISSLRTPSTGYWIAHRWDMNDGVYGDYSKVMMYDRALTSSEIMENYYAFNTRFVGAVGTGISSSSITTTVNPVPSIPVITVNGDRCINKTSLTTPLGLNSYAWYKDDVIISGNTTNTLTPNASGDYKVVVSNGTCSNTSVVTTIYTCGRTAIGKMLALTNAVSLISSEGGANFGTATDDLGRIANTTGLTTTVGTIDGSTAVLGGVISSTNGIASSVGVIYSTDLNFGTYSTATIQTNVAAGTYTSTISGLSSSTSYYAKSFIVNKAGTSYGTVISFTTPTVVPTKVAVTRASVGRTYGAIFTTQPQVTIQTASGSTVTNSSETVTASISSGGALIGTKSVNAVNGVATFTNLGLKGMNGIAYTITYTVSGLTTATESVTPTGSWSLGNTGPGGGKIFYVNTSGFACGPTLSETCYYLEVAPALANSAKDWSVSANRTSSAGASGTVIGSGYQNTMAIINQGNSNSAAAYAQEYRGGSLSDWYLGTRLELYQIYVNRATIFTGTEVINTEFPGEYWTSTEANASQAYSYRIYDNQGPWPNSKTSNSVRPIRSF